MRLPRVFSLAMSAMLAISTVAVPVAVAGAAHTPVETAVMTSEIFSISASVPELTQEQIEFAEQSLGPEAVKALEDAMKRYPSDSYSNEDTVRPFAIPAVIAGVAIGAVAWCSAGVLGGFG